MSLTGSLLIPAVRTPTPPDTKEDRFLKLLPAICRAARYAFRRFPPDAKEEAVQEVVASSLGAYRALCRRGRESVATSSSLAAYAIAHFRVGRSVTHSLNIDDISSKHCQRRKQIQIQSLQRYDTQACQWQELLIEDGKATPADTAAMRIDFAAWLSSLSPRMRALAELLAVGETTGAVATLFHVSAGRISQIRRKLMDAWNQFHEERVDQPTLVAS